MSILMGDILNAIESKMRALVLQFRALSLQSNLWPEGLAPDAVCLTVDVEWAHPVVLADLVSLFDSAGVAGTFFVTHDGVELPGHERGLHPNFRRNGDSYRAMRAQLPAGAAEPSDEEIYAFILKRTRSLCSTTAIRACRSCAGYVPYGCYTTCLRSRPTTRISSTSTFRQPGSHWRDYGSSSPA
jgi:hypothetical protein